MKKKILIAAILILAGLTLVWLGIQRPIQIVASDGIQVIDTRAWNVGQILSQAGISLQQTDHVSPALSKLSGWQNPVYILRSSQVRIVDRIRGLDVTISSRERVPANQLLDAGLMLFPGDQILLNGQNIPIDEPLAYQSAYTLQIIPAQHFSLNIDGNTIDRLSGLPSLGQALWSAGYHLRLADQVSQNLAEPLKNLGAVDIQTAQAVKIVTADERITTLAAGSTIGQVLSDANISLQGLDYSIPAENEPVPENGKIQLVRVQEDILLNQTIIPYESESIQDSSTELGQTSILKAGEYGLKVSRERIRYENGVEVNRQTEAEWVAAEPKSELLGIGTKIVLNTVDTPSGTLKYWRSITAYATSYSPCNLGNDTCNSTTASGQTLTRGIVAVSCSSYSTLQGMQVYIPGYGKGVIADCGGGISGVFWIDLGFSDDDYESWHGSVTVYFLAPAPTYIPYELQ